MKLQHTIAESSARRPEWVEQHFLLVYGPCWLSAVKLDSILYPSNLGKPQYDLSTTLSACWLKTTSVENRLKTIYDLKMLNLTHSVKTCKHAWNYTSTQQDCELYEDSRKHAWLVVSCYHVNTKHALSGPACSCLGDQLESEAMKWYKNYLFSFSRCQLMIAWSLPNNDILLKKLLTSELLRVGMFSI